MPFSDLTMQRIREEMEVNFFSVAEVSLAFLPLLLQSTDARVLLLGSVAAYYPTPFYSIYNASKAALAQLGNTMRVELAPFNIKVIQACARSSSHPCSGYCRHYCFLTSRLLLGL